MQDLLHPGMVHELVAEIEPVVLVALHPQRESSQTPDSQEGIIGRDTAAQENSDLSDPLDKLTAAGHHSQQQIGMTGEIFRT